MTPEPGSSAFGTDSEDSVVTRICSGTEWKLMHLSDFPDYCSWRSFPHLCWMRLPFYRLSDRVPELRAEQTSVQTFGTWLRDSVLPPFLPCSPCCSCLPCYQCHPFLAASCPVPSPLPSPSAPCSPWVPIHPAVPGARVASWGSAWACCRTSWGYASWMPPSWGSSWTPSPPSPCWDWVLALPLSRIPPASCPVAGRFPGHRRWLLPVLLQRGQQQNMTDTFLHRYSIFSDYRRKRAPHESRREMNGRNKQEQREERD